jgi:NADPH-dependent curcumin reductase CurA
MAMQNRQFRLAARPVGEPKQSDFEFTEEAAREPTEG